MKERIQPKQSVFYDSRDVTLRNMVAIASAVLLALNLTLNLLPTPKEDRKKARELPPRLTKLVM